MDKYEVAARLTIAGLDGFTGVLTYKLQRHVFGYVPFGRKTVTIDCCNQGRVYGRYTAPITRDTVPYEFSFEQIAKATRGGLSF